MSGTLDGATPPSSADVAATGLRNSRSLVFPGLGHAVIGSECARTTMVAFLNQPAGGYDASCVDNLTVPPFATG